MSSTAGFFRPGGRSATPWSGIDLPLIAADDDPADDDPAKDDPANDDPADDDPAKLASEYRPE